MAHINSFNTTNSFNRVWNDCTIIDGESQLLTWLSPLEPRLRHQDIRDRRVEDVGEWLLQTEEFRGWCAGSGGDRPDDAILFCYGDPGVGKTYISSLVIDSLCDRANGQNIAIACFYFDFAVQKEQSATSMLGALLRQVVGGPGGVPGGIAQAYEDQKKVIGGRPPRLPDIVKMLQTTSSENRTFICIDALDECEAEHRVKILNSLNQILQKSPGTRIFVTGRPHIWNEIGKRLSGRVRTIRITPRRDDIISYLRDRLGRDTTSGAMNSMLEADILKKIPQDISEIFLLVSLNIDAILQETTIHRRRQKLNLMADGLGLGDAYDATLDRIREQGVEKARLGMATLMWISHSERPLKSDELCHALAVEIGSPNFNTENVPAVGTLLDCCQGLVVVDKEASIRLIHFTLQEYLRAHPELFGTAHSTIAETCLSYLNSQQVSALPPSLFPDLKGTPFLEYSSLYWGMHAKRELSECAKLLALKLFDDYNNHISTKILLRAQKSYVSLIDFNKSSLFNGLHCASVFGIDEIVASLVEMAGCDINQEDCVGNTPLAWAAWHGHEGSVRILLGRDDVSPDKSNEDGQTPLWLAAENSHVGVMKLLLRLDDVNPDKPNQFGHTPLCWAARNGHEGMVGLLLGRDDLNPNKPDEGGQTPLAWAAYKGHEKVVQLLLGRNGINPDKPDQRGRTPLRWAARNGHEGVVKLLLGGGDVDPDKPDEDGQTPLWLAAENGHAGVVKLLLRRHDVNPNNPSKYGQTLLCWAAYKGHEGMVKLLLGRDDVNPDKLDEDGQTPLWSAAENGHGGVLALLLGRHDVNPNKSSRHGQTPLLWAAYKGHEGMVKMLLRRDDVNPDKPNKYDQTPLWLAAENGHAGVVKILLGQGDINPDKPDLYGQTPLSRAACNGHKAVVKILLRRDDVSPDKSDKDGQTPLGWAACNGHERVVKMLLGQGDVNPCKPDEYGKTPLLRAACNGHEGVVKLLLRWDDVNSDKPDKYGQTPLWWAAYSGHEGVVKILLRRDGVSPDEPNKHGQTPLWWAARHGHEGVVKLLLRRGDINPNKPNKHGQTPLFRAAWNAHKGVVKLLLGREDISPDEPDENGRTPFCCAAWNGHEGVVKILLERDDVNPDKPDEDGRTPLWWATKNSHAGVIALLQPPTSATHSAV